MIMPAHLPEFIDPLEFAEKRRQVVGELPLAAFDRIQEFLAEKAGIVRVDLSFGRDERLFVVTGRVECDLVLRCQLCLEPLKWPAQGAVSLGVVGSLDEADLLPESYEPLMFGGESTIRLLDLVQDELLLVIPPIPQHQVCGSAAHAGPRQEPRRRENPFAVLAQLKNND